MKHGADPDLWNKLYGYWHYMKLIETNLTSLQANHEYKRMVDFTEAKWLFESKGLVGLNVVPEVWLKAYPWK